MTLALRSEVVDFLKKHTEPKRSPDELGRLGKYQLLHVLGIGGMGIVFHARDQLLRRDVALKVLLPEKIVDDEARKQFLREARAAATIKHDNVMPLLDANFIKDVIYLVMPFLAGSTVKQRVQKSGTLSVSELLQMARESAMGLAAAHEQSILHRDISPNNLWLEKRGDKFHTMLLDFGLAKVQNVKLQSTVTYQPQSQVGRSTRINASAAATTVKGTLGYMAPEQFDGKTSVQSDLFSLGATLFHAATGSPPFSGSDMNQMAMNNYQQEPSNVSKLRNDLPLRLQDLITKLMSRRSEDRPASAKEVVEECEAIQKSLAVHDKTTIVSPVVHKQTTIKIPFEKPARFKSPRFIWPLAAVGVALLIAILVFLLYPRTTELAKATTTGTAGTPISITVARPFHEKDLLIDLIVKKSTGELININEKDPRNIQGLPVVAGDQFQVQIRSESAPIYPYVIRFPSDGKAKPLYPWKHEAWDSHSVAGQESNLRIPAEANEVMSYENGPDGIETILVWALTESQPNFGKKLEEHFAQYIGQPATIDNYQGMLWHRNGLMLAQDPRFAMRGTEVSNDPVLRLKKTVEDARKALGGTNLMLTIAKQGKSGTPPASKSTPPAEPARVVPQRFPSPAKLNSKESPLGKVDLSRAMLLSSMLPHVNKILDEGNALLKAANFPAAKVKYDEAVKYMESKLEKDDPFINVVAQGLALYFVATGDPKSAERYATKHLRLMQNLSDHFPVFASLAKPGLVASLNTSSLIAELNGNMADALMYSRESLLLAEKVYPGDNEHHWLAICNLSASLFKQSNFAEAEVLARQALKMMESLTNTPANKAKFALELAKSQNNLGEVLRAQGRLDEAVQWLRSSVILREEAHLNPNDRALGIQNLAQVLADLGKFEEAIPYHQQAWDLLLQVFPQNHFPRGHPLLALVENNYAITLEAAGKADMARTFHDRAIKTNQKLYPLEFYPLGHQEFARSLSNYGAFLFRQGQKPEAIKHWQDALAMDLGLLNRELGLLSEAESFTLVSAVPANLNALLTATRDQPYDATLHALQWKAKSVVTKAMEDRRRQLAISEDTQAKQLSEQLQSTRQQLMVTLQTAVYDDTLRAKAKQLTEQKEELEKRLARRLREVHLPVADAHSTPEKLRTALPPGTAFIDLMLYSNLAQPGPDPKTFQQHYTAYVIRRDQAPVRIELGPAEPIHQALAAWRELITKQADPGNERQAARVFSELVFEPLRSQLPGGLKLCYLSPDSLLHQVPWSALPGSSANSLLLQHHPVSIVPHGNFLAQQLSTTNSPQFDGKMLVMGGLQYGTADNPATSFSYLPGTKQECELILELLHRVNTQQPINRIEATSNANEVLNDLAGCRIAHLATNGYYRATAGNRELSDLQRRSPMTLTGIALAQANVPSGTDHAHLLTAEQIVGKDLSQLQLAVLSACDSALGQATAGEGNQGLQRAFHIAGCPHTITALWKVPDQETSSLMSLFYRNLLVKKLPLHVSLQKAQLELMYRPEVHTELLPANRAATLEKWMKEATQPPSIPDSAARAKTGSWAAFQLSGK